MPWVRVTGRIIDTGVERQRLREEARRAEATTPVRNVHETDTDTCATKTKMTQENDAQDTSVKHDEDESKDDDKDDDKDNDADDADNDADDADDAEAYEEWRTRMIFRDLLCEYYPRYGVSSRKFKASRTDATFSTFPEPGTFAVILR